MKVQNIIYLIPIALLFSCNSNTTENKVVKPIAAEDQVKLFNSLDATSYIGFVNRYYFQKTDEFYTELYFKNTNIVQGKYEKIAASGDSTIFQDDENHRNRIPLKVASEEFDLTGLKTLSLFDEKHNFLTKAQFVRVEYLNQNISPVFTAVYKPNIPQLAEKAKYCIGNLNDKIIKEEYTPFEDKSLTTDIVQKMGYSHNYTLDGKHYRNIDRQRVVSIINSDTTAAIIEQKNDSYQCLYKSNSAEGIIDIVFLPINKNGHPIILTKSVLPDSDLEWDNLLVFDGKRYTPLDKQRIKNQVL